MARIKIGNYVIGINGNRTEHALMGKFMIGKTAYTIGVVNKIPNTENQMLFADFDTSTLRDVLLDIKILKSLFKVGDILLFQSGENSDKHYFIISPFHYLPFDIRTMLAYMICVDTKFISSYIRYGDNTIRIIPKVQGKKEFRPIKFLMNIAGNNPKAVAVTGMFSLLEQFYPIPYEINEYIHDKTIKDDLIMREYETIRW